MIHSGPQPIQAGFEAQTRQTPHRPALIWGEQILSYDQLNQQANRLAQHLQARGVGPEVLVGLCADRSFDMVIGVLAVLKAGGAYVPLDPAYPAERLNFIIRDARAPLLLTQPHLADRLPAHPGQTVLLDDDFSAYPATNPTPALSPENAAYVLYTSGSTGQPKGVVGVHRVVNNRLHHEPYPVGPDEVFAQKTSLNFIDAIWEIFLPLRLGLSTVLVPEDTLADPRRLIDLLSQHRVTRLVFVPSLLRMLLSTAEDLAARLPHLQYWISSGEALPVDLADHFAARLPGATLVNLYGTSEIWDATWHPFNPEKDRKRVPIGQPLANVDIHILDESGQPVPASESGELHVGGLGLARGYHRRPALTAERFVPHPTEAGTRLYKTGDLARFHPETGVEYLGRLDHQVKIRGHRIELGEIEATLGQHPRVRQAVVTAPETEADGRRLVAYTVPLNAPGPAPAELRRFLAEQLPPVMVPALYVSLDSLPLTPNGKLDRRALPTPSLSRPAVSTAYVPPRTTTETAIATVWADLLPLERVGVQDNFVEIGGDSLLATQIVSRLRDVCRVEVPIRYLFETATLAQLAERIDVIQWATSPPPAALPADFEKGRL